MTPEAREIALAAASHTEAHRAVIRAGHRTSLASIKDLRLRAGIVNHRKPSMNVVFPGLVGKIEVTPKGKFVVTVHGESTFKGTEVSFEIPREHAASYPPGAPVTVTISPVVEK